MIRLATGDLSAVLPGPSPCGRTNTRIRGWLGRADQTTKIRGMFVHPGQVAQAVKPYPALARVRLVVTREGEQDRMVLMAECAASDPSLAERIAASMQAATKLRCEVQLVAPGTLPNDGKVIADERKYD
jgi:phenylacetate-CoA ligase